MNAPPINDPEAKATRLIKVRFRKASFKPNNRIPTNAMRLTKITDVRIMISSDTIFQHLGYDFSPLLCKVLFIRNEGNDT